MELRLGKYAFPQRTLLIGAGVIFLLLIAVPFGCSWLFGARPPADRTELLKMIADARDSLDAPGRTVAAAAKTLKTPEEALTFVRDRVALADYRYRRLDPDVVMAWRVASPIDKAVLLKALLEAQGLEAEVRNADWPKDGTLPIRGAEQQVTPQLDLLYRALRAQTSPTSEGDGRKEVEAMQAAVNAASAKLEPLVENVAALAPWSNFYKRYWVQARTRDAGGKPGEWTAYDPLFRDQPTDGGYSQFIDPVKPVKLELLAEDARGVRRSLMRWEGPIRGDLTFNYLPAVGTAEWLEGNKGPETVPLWRPILTANGAVTAGKPFAPDGSVPQIDVEGKPVFDGTGIGLTPKVRSLQITEIDASRYPRITALVNADVEGTVAWRSPFLSLTDNGKHARVRIDSQPASIYGGRTVVFVIDNSGSMHDDFDRVRQIMFDLIDRLGAGVRVGMTDTEQASSLRVPPRLLDDKAALKVQIEAVLKPGGANHERQAMETVLREVRTPVDIVYIGDGEMDSANDAPKIREAADLRDSRIYSILVAGKPDLYQRFSNVVWTALPGELPEVLTARLAGSFTDQLRISWDAAGPAGSERAVTLASAGWQGGPAKGSYDPAAAPDALPAESPLGPGLILRVDMDQGSEPVARRILPLERPGDVKGLMSGARVMLVPGLVPESALMARNLDEWYRLGVLQRDGKKAQLPGLTGPSYWTMARGNGLLRNAMSAYRDALVLEEPLVLVERAAIAGDGSAGKLIRSLDLLNPRAILPLVEQPEPWRIGLAVAAAEGMLLGVDGIAPELVNAPALKDVRDPGQLPPDLRGSAEARSIVKGNQFTFLAVPGAGQRAWLVQRGGDYGNRGRLEARLFDPPAKGARAEAVIAQFDQIQTNLGRLGMAVSAWGGVPQAPLGGLMGLLTQDMKLWCFSSVMMGYVTEDIEGTLPDNEQDPIAWQKRAADGCKINIDKVAQGYIGAMVSSAVSNAITEKLGNGTTKDYKRKFGEKMTKAQEFVLGYALNKGFDSSGINSLLEWAFTPR